MLGPTTSSRHRAVSLVDLNSTQENVKIFLSTVLCSPSTSETMSHFFPAMHRNPVFQIQCQILRTIRWNWCIWPMAALAARQPAVGGPKISSPARKRFGPARPDPISRPTADKSKHNSAICMLNIINSPAGEARVGSGDGVIDSLRLQGRWKGWCGCRGGGCGPQKRCMWASQPTSWAVC